MSAQFELSRERDNNIFIFRETDNSCTPHFHSNIEITYLLSGKKIFNHNGIQHKIEKDFITVSNSYDIHSYSTISKSDTIIMIIPVSLIKSFARQSKGMIFKDPIVPPSRITSKIKEILLDLLSKPEPCEICYAKGSAYLILGHILSQVELVQAKSSMGTDLAHRLLSSIQNNYLGDIRLEVLARQLGYNREYISRFFNKFIGCSYNDYVNSLRVRHAANLISSSSDTFMAISQNSGFQNYRTFNRAFQKEFNVSPTEFRENLTTTSPSRDHSIFLK